jgi:hypothetical protein
MAIKDARLQRALDSGNSEQARLLRKASQEWDMAGLAREDGDHRAATEHMSKAKEYERQAKEME